MSRPTVPRFTTGQRVFHWVYFLAFLVLAVTGFVLMFPWQAMTAGDAGETNRLLHRVFGVALIVAPLVVMLVARRALLRDIVAGFTWKRADIESLKVLMLRAYWNGDKTGLPPQGKFMAGQKLNIIAQTLLFFLLAATGLVIWFGKGSLSQPLMVVMILAHALSAIAATCLVIVHIYMSAMLPLTRDAIGAMFTGRMDADLARSHHPDWKPDEESR